MIRLNTVKWRMSPKLVTIFHLVFVFSVISIGVKAQSNYAEQSNSIEYQNKPNELPGETVLDGRVTKLDDLSPIIFLNRTKAALNCGAGSMQIEMKFNEPFFGLAYADFDRNSACQITGKGALSYKLELPLKGCGTRQEPQRVFTNNVVVRFHPGLEMDGDEIITIVCRYPPPIAETPAGLPAAILNPVAPAAIIPPLKGIQLLMIICAIMFLTLLLLGLGVSYYCLRRRPVPIVRRLPMSMGSGSEITKLSGSSLGNLSQFEGLKIPRVHAPLAAIPSSSGSDEPIISDTLPSDYPSESHSEVEEVDTRSLPVSSTGSFENRAFVQETSSIYSENYGHTQEFQAANAMAQLGMVPRHPIAIREPSPKFDVQVRVKRAPPPPPSPLSSDTESIATTPRNNLSTIMETHEDRESVITMDSLPHDVARSQFTYVPELHAAPKQLQQPPILQRVEYQRQEQRWPPRNDFVDAPPHSIGDTRSLVSLGTEMTDTHSVSEMIDASHLYPHETYHTAIHMEQVERLPEPPIVARKPEITSHLVDDVFLRTITEKRTIEDVEKYKRSVTEYKAVPIPDPTWDVTIRNLPQQEQVQPQWENFSDISSASGMTLTPKMDRSEFSLPVPPPNYIEENAAKLRSPELVGNMKPIEIPPEDKSVPNWDVLIRVLEQEDENAQPIDDVSSEHSSRYLTRHISYEDKEKWKDIITTQSTLRTMLTEAVVKEDFERIRTDVRYEKIFQPQTWDVIIRILAPPDDAELRAPKRNKKQPWDTRSRRSSLPTLYEYDSDGGSSVRTISQDPNAPQFHYNRPQSSRTSRSSFKSDHVDIRSMSEIMVDFARHSDNFSEASSAYRPNYDDEEPYDRRSFRSLHRSLSQPSLARSTGEVVEHWGVVAPDDGSEYSSPDQTPRVRRVQRTMTTFHPPSNGQMVTESHYVEQSSSSFQVSGSKTSPPKEWYSSTADDDTK